MKKTLTLCALLCLFCQQTVLASEEKCTTYDSTNCEEIAKHENHEKLFASNLSIDFVVPLHKVQKKDEKVQVRVWGYHQFKNNIVLDIDVGYLSRLSASMQAGYNTLKKNDLWLAPKAGFSVGDYNSIGVGIFFKLNKKKTFILQNVQYNFGLTSKNKDIFFWFSEVAYGPHFLEGGFISEFAYKYKPLGDKIEAQKEWLIGPSLRGTYKNFYLEGFWGLEPLLPKGALKEKSKLVFTLGFKFTECKNH